MENKTTVNGIYEIKELNNIKGDNKNSHNELNKIEGFDGKFISIYLWSRLCLAGAWRA